jgi:hypothetical protein
MSKRLSLRTSLLLAGCLIYSGSQFAFGQRPVFQPQPGFAPQPVAPQAGPARLGRDDRRGDRDHILRTSLIVGAPVALQGGVAFGRVQDFVFNDSGCVDFVVVNNEGRFYPIPWGLAMYQFDNRALVLDIDRARIGQIPTYTQISELGNPQFVQRVHTFFRGDLRDGRRGEMREGRPGAANRPGTAPNPAPRAPTPPAANQPANGNRPASNQPANERNRNER